MNRFSPSCQCCCTPDFRLCPTCAACQRDFPGRLWFTVLRNPFFGRCGPTDPIPLECGIWVSQLGETRGWGFRGNPDPLYPQNSWEIVVQCGGRDCTIFDRPFVYTSLFIGFPPDPNDGSFPPDSFRGGVCCWTQRSGFNGYPPPFDRNGYCDGFPGIVPEGTCDPFYIKDTLNGGSGPGPGAGTPVCYSNTCFPGRTGCPSTCIQFTVTE